MFKPTRLIVATVLLSSPLMAQDIPLHAPWQIDGIELTTDRSSSWDDIPERLVIVGLGRAPDPQSPDAGGPVPAGDDLEWITILGTEGWAHAWRVSIERRCEFLCAYDGGEECHWVGLYSQQEPAHEIGRALGAIPGRLPLEDYQPLATGGDSDTLARLDAAADPGEPSSLLWSAFAEEVTLDVALWAPETGRFDGVLTMQYSEQPVTATGCSAEPYEWLLAIDCREFAVLASGGRPLLLSFADYNTAKVQPVARFVYGGSRHYVVRVGSKAQDVIGLVSAEPAGWRARFRPRDWAGLC